jgi:uncharacterized protein (TIGR02722 family)
VKYGICASVAMAVLLLGGSGCATRVRYGDATSAAPLSTNFGSSDLQQIAAVMCDSLLADSAVREATTGRKPVMLVDRIKNKTLQHIDTESITDSIRTKLIQSGKFRFLDRQTDQAALDEFHAQRESGLVDPAKAVPMGTQYGAEYILVANLAQIEERLGSKTDVYYKFTMSLKNLRTGILDWAQEKEIRKEQYRSWFGR